MLIGIKRVAEILGVDVTTVYGYIRQELIPVHTKKIKVEGTRTWARVWLESDIIACVATIAAHKAKPRDYSKLKESSRKKAPDLSSFDLAASLMRVTQ